MGRSRKFKAGAGNDQNKPVQLTSNLTPNQLSSVPTPSAPPFNLLPPTPSAPPLSLLPPTPSAPPLSLLPPNPSAPPLSLLPPNPSAPPLSLLPPTPSAPPLSLLPPAPSAPSMPASDPVSLPPSLTASPDDIIVRLKPTCGEFTRPIPGVASTLTWAQLRDLSSTQLTNVELADITDPHELFRSLVGSDGRLLTALRSALNPGDLLDIDRTNEIRGLLVGWMDVRRGLGLPPILDPDGVEITSARLNPLSCRISADRRDLAEYSDKWRVVSSFVQARPPIFKAVFAEVFIPTTITGGSEGGMACLEGFCDYAFLKMKDAITTCFADEDRRLPTVLPPMTGAIKMRRGLRAATIELDRIGSSVAGALEIRNHRDDVLRFLQTTYPDVVWTADEIDTIFNELRRSNADAYRGGTKRRRKHRKTKRIKKYMFSKRV